MKQKSTPPPGHGKTNRGSDLLKAWLRPVHYRWSTPAGMICHGHTVVLATTKRGLAQAERRFWSQHRHVQQEAA
jgi:hypothetical protein